MAFRFYKWHGVFGAVLLSACGVIAFLNIPHGGARENSATYSVIEEGLMMGGRVSQAPAGVQAVLNLSELKDDYSAEDYRWQAIADGPPVPSVAWLEENVAFIEGERTRGRVVFVHCDAGTSRSGMVVAAYLMQAHGWTPDEALRQVRMKRETVRPNAAFMELLSAWQEALAKRKV